MKLLRKARAAVHGHRQAINVAITDQVVQRRAGFQTRTKTNVHQRGLGLSVNWQRRLSRSYYVDRVDAR